MGSISVFTYNSIFAQYFPICLPGLYTAQLVCPNTCLPPSSPPPPATATKQLSPLFFIHKVGSVGSSLPQRISRKKPGYTPYYMLWCLLIKFYIIMLHQVKFKVDFYITWNSQKEIFVLR